MTERTHVSTSLIILCILLAVAAGCAPASTQAVDLATSTSPSIPSPVATVEATSPSGWETRSLSTDSGQCGFAISHPAGMEAVSQGTYNWIINFTSTEPSGPVPNFVYVSVIPDEFQSSEPGAIYNYDPAATQTLLNMQVGESKSVHGDPNMASGFTYTRLPDSTLSNQTAQTYENTQPWEFPQGTKEIRYYLKANGCTYLFGGYMSTAGSEQPGAINEELFNQIIATFQVSP